MKRADLLFSFLLLPVDYLAIVLAGFTAYGLRFSSVVTDIRPVYFDLPWANYYPTVLLVAVGWVVIFALSGLYRSRANQKFAAEINRIVLACSTGFAAITIYVFFTLSKFDSRFLVLAGWVLAVVFVILGRGLVRGIRAWCYHFGLGLKRVVIIGEDNIADTITHTLKTKKYLGYTVTGTYPRFDSDIAHQILLSNPDELLLADPRATREDALSAVDFANEHHLTFKYSADLFSTISTNLVVYTIAGVPIIELGRTRITGWGRIIKRFVDIVGSLLLLVLFSPLFILVAIATAADSGRPLIYKNERVGQEGKRFFVLKFRSMFLKDCTGEQFGKAGEIALSKEEHLIKSQSIKTGPVYKIANDPRITKVGRFIRRTSLDELPQLLNVLKGEMSLVGPRPHQPREVANYEKWHKAVIAIKPGLTGLAQISGRSDLSFDEEVRLDTFYMENWSLFLDFIILIKTPFIVIRHKGAI